MQFTVRGFIDEREAAVTWNNGDITGDEKAIDSLRLESGLCGELGRTGGPYYVGDYLDNPTAAFLLLAQRVFTEIVEVAGDPLPGADTIRKRMNLPKLISDLANRDTAAALRILQEWGEGRKPVAQLWEEATDALERGE